MAMPFGQSTIVISELQSKYELRAFLQISKVSADSLGHHTLLPSILPLFPPPESREYNIYALNTARTEASSFLATIFFLPFHALLSRSPDVDAKRRRTFFFKALDREGKKEGGGENSSRIDRKNIKKEEVCATSLVKYTKRVSRGGGLLANIKTARTSL